MSATNMTSNKPYLVRAMYDWIVDNGLTPYLLVTVDHGGVEAPMSYAKQGKIVFNISPASCRGLHLENDRIIFTAKFSGESVQVFVVPQAVLAIYAQENGKGMEFPEEPGFYEFPKVSSKTTKRPKLSIVQDEKDEQ